ncbi:CPBP family intramembrane glutamic endopeptidase [Mucilaginibacter psychrotolerans]|uniref:CPBP family intramembrane metalloprotease n=1 Tax=Mucilaginibacter psychrotolerans TaxID=1524096 RepID=A0A4Y8SK06_9SPHI|nr:CPBP family intramembrane glutamic endopeptidase [Mucilaginibacter psychrotolerans]TFF39238.1 CPBP family intramembrane metalloprotease [Mucilaginibacter psychrotolerans]
MLSEETVIEPVPLLGKKACISCTVLIDSDCKFCNSCGARQTQVQGANTAEKWQLLQQGGVFFGLTLIVCCLAKFVDALQNLTSLIIIDAFLAIGTVAFFATGWQENKRLLHWPNFSIQKLSLYCGIAMAGAFLVHYSVTWLNITIFSKEESYIWGFIGYPYAKVLLIFFTAVTPAIFEELGFRGYLLQILLKVADEQQAVYISAFLFAIIHLSFLSLFWLIPFALFIGYMRVKEHTLWYGIFFHFCFNLTACLFELL